jgi:HNH endonuclease
MGMKNKSGFPTEKPCDVCGGGFRVTYSSRKKRVCGLECLKKLRRKFFLNCKQCNKELAPGYYRGRAFCDAECRRLFGTNPANHPLWNPDRIRSCKNCGNQFEAGSEKKKKGMICSRKCYNEWIGKHGRTHRAPMGHVKMDIKGGRKYVKVSEGKYQLEHRAVVESHLGRKLLSSEVVHHINGNHSDNRVENLLVTSQSNHMKIHKEAERIGLSVMAANNWMPTVEGMGC